MFAKSAGLVICAALVTQGLVGADVAASSAAQAPAAARADQVWSEVIKLGANQRGADVVVDQRGTATVVWATGDTPRLIKVVRRPRGGSWSKPIVIGHGAYPQAAVDGRGVVTAVWVTKRRGLTDGVLAARATPGGHWSTPLRLTTDLKVPGYPHQGEGVYGATTVSVAANNAGAVVAAWAWGSNPRSKPWRIQSAYRPAGGAWRKTVTVTPASGAKAPQVGIDRNGGVVLAYQGPEQSLVARRRLPRTGWTKPVLLAKEAYMHQLAVGASGASAVTYYSFAKTRTPISGIYRPAGGPWGSADVLWRNGEGYSLAMRGGAEANVVAYRQNGRIDLVSHSATGDWSAPVQVVPEGYYHLMPVIVANRAGARFLSWGMYALYGTYQPAGGDWGPVVTLSPDAGVEVLEWTDAAIGSAGDVAMMWKQEARQLKVRVAAAP